MMNKYWCEADSNAKVKIAIHNYSCESIKEKIEMYEKDIISYTEALKELKNEKRKNNATTIKSWENHIAFCKNNIAYLKKIK